MAFVKHVGRNGDRKVAVVFREVPGDSHMCLVVYPDLLPMHIHDPLMKVLESDVGQQATDLADALFRNLLPDGRNMLQTLHAEGLMKRVQTDNIIMTPNANSTVKLSELNRIVNEMKQGEDAVKRMAELDKNSGLVDPSVKRKAESEFKNRNQPQPPTQTTANNALDDRALAANLLAQAERMQNDATNLIKEASRMRKEAEDLFPGVKPSTNNEGAKKRGRPSKAVMDASVQ